MYTGIICACLPCLRPFAKHYIPNSFIFGANFEDRLASLRFYAMSALRLFERAAEEKIHKEAQDKSHMESPVDSSITSDDTRRDEDDVRRLEEGRTMSAGLKSVQPVTIGAL